MITRCHHTEEEVQASADDAADAVNEACVEGITKASRNRWQAFEEANAKITLGTNLCAYLPTSFRCSVGKPSQVATALMLAERNNDEVRIAIAKRLQRCNDHLAYPLTPYRQMAQSIVMVPLDKHFSTVFAAEAVALRAVSEGQPGVPRTPRMPLIESLSNPKGHLWEMQKAGGDMIRAATGRDLQKLIDYYPILTSEQRHTAIRESRAAVLRSQGDLKTRHVDPWLQDPWAIISTYVAPPVCCFIANQLISG